MAAVLLIGMSAPASVLAEGEEETTTVTKTEATIDSSKTGSLTLYKYDSNAAANGSVSGSYDSTGEANSEVESAYGAYAIAGVTFTALKVADIATYTYTKDDGSKGVEVVYSLDSSLATILGLETSEAVQIDATNYWTSTQISNALANKLASDASSNVTTTIDALKNYITNTSGSSSAVSQITGTDGKATWTDLALGLYLVVETAVPDQVNTTTDPFFVSIPMTTSDGEDWLYDVTAYPKNQTDFPDITKKVRESSNTSGAYTDTVSTSINDKLDYRIVSKLPEITSEATYLTKYTFVDTLSKGQTYNNDITVSFYASITDRNAASLGAATVTLTATEDYTVQTSGGDGSDTVITISLTTTGLAKVNAGASASTENNGNYSYIVISYTATLNDDAVLGDSGNENDVKLTYARTSTGYEETLEDKTEVYTFGLDITKELSGGTASDVSGVQFTLQNSAGDYITAKQNSSGNYTVTGLAESSTDSNNTIFSPAEGGSLYIAGIEAGEYTLTEVKTVSGYNLLKDSIKIVITTKAEEITATYAYYTSDNNGNTVTTTTTTGVTVNANPASSSATVNGEMATMSADGTLTTSLNAAVVMEITNTKGFTLPTTGGAGIWLIVILGVVIGGLGIYSFVSKRREEN